MIMLLGMTVLASILSTAGSSKIGYTFVLDNSGSMSKEIMRVEHGLKTLIRETPYAVASLVIVLYNDPEIGPYKKVNTESHISSFLKSVQLKDGGDCAEMAMSALKKGIELSDPESVIFLITDADPKDYKLENTVVQKAKEKNLTTYFILTGCCDNCNSYRFQTYNRTARQLNGWSYKVQEKEGVQLFMAYLNILAKYDASLVKLSPKSEKEMFHLARTQNLSSEMTKSYYQKPTRPRIANRYGKESLNGNAESIPKHGIVLLLVPVIGLFLLS